MPSGVEFDTDQNYGSRSQIRYSDQNTQASGMSGWLVNKGFAKGAQHATYILIAIVLINCIVMYIAWKSSSAPTNEPKPLSGQTN